MICYSRLDTGEAILCSTLRLTPTKYLNAKDRILASPHATDLATHQQEATLLRKACGLSESSFTQVYLHVIKSEAD